MFDFPVTEAMRHNINISTLCQYENKIKINYPIGQPWDILGEVEFGLTAHFII
jgi:hypothetical protein